MAERGRSTTSGLSARHAVGFYGRRLGLGAPIRPASGIDGGRRLPGGLLIHVQLKYPADHLRPVGHPELAVDPFEMGVDGVRGDRQARSHRAFAASVPEDQARDLRFTVRETEGTHDGLPGRLRQKRSRVIRHGDLAGARKCKAGTCADFPEFFDIPQHWVRIRPFMTGYPLAGEDKNWTVLKTIHSCLITSSTRRSSSTRH
jgi:hypothetical protein